MIHCPICDQPTITEINGMCMNPLPGDNFVSIRCPAGCWHRWDDEEGSHERVGEEIFFNYLASWPHYEEARKERERKLADKRFRKYIRSLPPGGKIPPTEQEEQP